ncbi:KEOPS complex subunit Pcc1 [Methanofervidicoccus sp. A16]|uniref:KEOPS complex subunit Pcc1 n=1 Tax=Methanofervidicoccus sp. A16 TaxID=2607662 RepID=UPI00209BCE88|nr:KEOPS complex subunit Pcc1 [Methanofervidicoccus sp. A16]
MRVKYRMRIPGDEVVYRSLKVDDVNEGLIIETSYQEKDNILELYVETDSIGSLKNILDDYFKNYEMSFRILELVREEYKGDSR